MKNSNLTPPSSLHSRSTPQYPQNSYNKTATHHSSASISHTLSLPSYPHYSLFAPISPSPLSSSLVLPSALLRSLSVTYRSMIRPSCALLLSCASSPLLSSVSSCSIAATRKRLASAHPQICPYSTSASYLLLLLSVCNCRNIS